MENFDNAGQRVCLVRIADGNVRPVAVERISETLKIAHKPRLVDHVQWRSVDVCKLNCIDAGENEVSPLIGLQVPVAEAQSSGDLPERAAFAVVAPMQGT